MVTLDRCALDTAGAAGAGRVRAGRALWGACGLYRRRAGGGRAGDGHKYRRHPAQGEGKAAQREEKARGQAEKREKGESLTDVDMVSIIQKTIKELSEEAEGYEKVGNIQEKENTLRQKQIIEKYLPKMMSEVEIKTVISSLDDKSIPNVMKHFKLNYAGKCDMKTVSEIAKQF